MGISMAWALLVTALFRRFTTAGSRSRPPAPEKPLVVAARFLPLGSVVTRDAVRIREVPERLFPSGGFSRVEDVVDRPATSGIQADEPVIEARLAPRGSGVGLAPLIPNGMRAIAVRVNDVVGVAGFVLPGMRVDVLITGKPNNYPETVTRTVLQNIVVLSAGQAIQADGKNAINAPVVTLLVSPADAEALTLANNDGHIQLVLRNSSDEALAATRGRQWHELYTTHAAESEAPRPAASVKPHRGPAAPAPPPQQPVAPPVPAAVPTAAPKPPDPVVVIRGSNKTAEPAAVKGGVQ
jgi:pilus assembly protein CpaB